MIFSHMARFCHTGVTFEQYSINIFGLTNKITIKTLMKHKQFMLITKLDEVC